MPAERTYWVGPTLRPYQNRALETWHASGRRGVVCLPNAKRFGLAALASVRASSLILCADRALVDEWTRTLSRWYSGAIGFAVDDEARVESVTVMTFDFAHRRAREVGRHFDLLVVDGDRVSAEIAGDLASMTLPGARLGLATMSLGGTVDRDAVTALAGRVLCEASTNFGGSRETVRLKVELGTDERARYADFHRQGVIDGCRQAARLAAFPRTKRALVSALLRDHRNDRTYVFAGFGDAARAISQDAGIPAIDSDLPQRRRDAIVAAFREGAFRAVVCAHGLADIADPPDANVFISVPGALGEGVHRQSVSEVLRARPGRPAVAYELVTCDTLDDRPTSVRA